MTWKFNPPPGWPVPPDDWVPPPGWAPDPSWPAAPPGWEFWTSADTPPGPEPTGLGPEPTGAGPSPVDPWPTPPPFPAQPPTAGQLPTEQPPGGQPPAGPGPGSPYAGPPGGPAPTAAPPLGRPSRVGWVVGIAVGVAVLIAGSGGAVIVANLDRLSPGDDDPSPTEAPVVAQASWDDCVTDPNTCNTGEVAAGGTLVWGVQAATEWNVHMSSGFTPALTQIMRGVQPSTGAFLPDGTWQWNLDLLAGEPEVTGEDPQTLVYRIRPEARWSDGTDITADDFAFLWRHNAADPDLCADCFPADTRGYDRIAEVTGSDGGKTVTVTMRDPDPEWFALFTYLQPAHLAAAEGFDLDTPEGVGGAADWFTRTVPEWSGGPWQVTGGDLSTEVTLEPNDQWYGQTGPLLDTLVFRAIDDPVAMRQAVESGEIDGTALPINAEPQPGDPPEGVLSHVGSTFAWDHLDLNLDRPGLDDPELRRAIFTAVDVQAVIELAYDPVAADTEPMRNHLFPATSPHHVDHLSGTGHGTGDIDAALAILDAAGYTIVDDVLTLDGDQVGPLTLQFNEGNSRRQVIAEIVGTQLGELGIDVTIESGPLFEILEERQFDIVVFGWSGGPLFARAGQVWHSENTSNFGSYDNPELDALVTEASSAPDQDLAAGYLNDALALLADDAHVLPIAYTPQETLLRDQFLNIRPHPLAAEMFANSHEWGLTGGG